MAATFIESGTGATGGLEFYSAVVGTVATETTTVRALHPRSLKITTLATPSFIQNLGAVVSSGRLSFYVRFSQFNSTSTLRLALFELGFFSAFQFQLTVTSAGVLQLFDGTALANQIGTNGLALSTNTWKRVSVAWAITNSTTYTIKVYVDGSVAINANNSTPLVSAGNQQLTMGDGTGNADATKAIFFLSDIYADDDATTTDPGDVNVTAKLPAALNTNNFGTLGGVGANRYNRVSDRPLSEANYIAHTGGTDVQENFGLQAPTAGDVDTTGAVYVGRSAWVWAKRGPVISTDPFATAGAGSGLSGTTIGATLSAAVKAGDIVVVAVADRMGGVAPTISDSVGGNTWTALSGPTTNTVRASKWYSILTNGGAAMVVTATFGSATAARTIAAAAWDGALFSAAPLDKNVTNANDSTTPFTCPTSGVLAQANEIVLGFDFSVSSAGVTATAPNLMAKFVGTGSSTTGAGVAIGYQAVAATTAVAPAFAGVSATSVQGTASFKYNPSAARVVGTPMLMDNGSESAIVLGTTPGFFSLRTAAASYPSNVAGIGMRSSGAGGADTYFYEGGTLVAYIPGPVGKQLALNQAVKRAAFF